MKRAIFSIAGLSIGIVAWIIVAACNQVTITTPVRSFDRPTDVALTCAEYRPDKELYDIHPLSECNPDFVAQTEVDMGALPITPFLGPNPQYQFLMALVTQSARGEVALVDANQNKLVSLQPKLPGFGFLPVGLDPEHIRATPDGCMAVTGNSGSCDYGVIDVATMVNGAIPQGDLGAPVSTTLADNVVRRIVAAVPDGNGGARVLPARPKWVEIAPDTTSAIHGYESGGKAGQCIGGVHKAWVALPNCQLLVKLNLDAPATPEVDPTHPKNPTVEQAIKITKTGAEVVTDLTTLSCPQECSGTPVDVDMTPPPPSDMAGQKPGDLSGVPQPNGPDLALQHPPVADLGNADGAAPLFNANQAFPGTIAVDVANGRMIIGDLYGERIDIIPVDGKGNLGTPRKVQLETGAGGVSVVRLSPRSFAGQYLYAIARDGSVRVIDMDREVECETNPDPRWSGGGIDFQNAAPAPDPMPQARQLGCFPLGQPDTPRRAWYAQGPGIQLTTGQLPKDIGFVHVDQPPGPTDNTTPPPAAAPGVLVGDFAWIVSSDGRGTIVDLYDGCPQPNQQDLNLATTGPFTKMCALGNVPISRAQTIQELGHPTPMLLDRLAHRIRNGHLRFQNPTTPSDPIGMPRVVDEFNPYTVAVPSTSQITADAGVPTTDAGVSPNLPGLYQQALPSSLIMTYDVAPTTVIKFVDPDRARNEVWSVSWEGALNGTQHTLGQWLPNGYFTDAGGAWCSHGVVAGDKLLYTGCIQDGDCDWKQYCVRDPAAPADVLNGMCLYLGGPDLTVDYWSHKCGKLLQATRKYRVLSAKMNQPLPSGITIPPANPEAFDAGTLPVNPGTQPTDFLKLAEIYEPEYQQQTSTCNTDDDCSTITVPPTSGPAGDLPTRCMADFDGVKRCLLGCDPAKGDDPAMTATPRCGLGFECATSTQNDLRCMRSPLDDNLFRECFLEFQAYEIHAGNAFTVEGTTSGFLTDVSPDPNTGECTLPPLTKEYDRLRQARVPIAPADTCALASPLDSIDATQLHNNTCLVPSPTGLTQTEIVHFENGVFNIAVTIPIDSVSGRVIVPPDGTSVGFNVTGGGNFLSAPLGVDVQAEDPTYLVVGPDHQTLYIVDGGKQNTTTGLRGQLLRLFSPTQTIDHLFEIR